MVWLALLADTHGVVHWPTHGGYNFVSGPLADATLLTAFGSAMALWWRRHQCHIPGCWRLQWHPHPVHGHPVCRTHHPDFGTVGASDQGAGLTRAPELPTRVLDQRGDLSPRGGFERRNPFGRNCLTGSSTDESEGLSYSTTEPASMPETKVR